MQITNSPAAAILEMVAQNTQATPPPDTGEGGFKKMLDDTMSAQNTKPAEKDQAKPEAEEETKATGTDSKADGETEAPAAGYPASETAPEAQSADTAEQQAAAAAAINAGQILAAGSDTTISPENEGNVPPVTDSGLTAPRITGKQDSEATAATQNQDQTAAPKTGAAETHKQQAQTQTQGQAPAGNGTQAAQGQAADTAAPPASAQNAEQGDAKIIAGVDAPAQDTQPDEARPDTEKQDKFSSMLERAKDGLSQYGKAGGAKAAEQTAQPKTAEPEPLVKQPLSELNRVAAVATRKEPIQETQPEQQTERQDAAASAAQPVREPISASTPAAQPAAPAAQARTQAQQVEARILENLENRRMEFGMQLYPKELGRVDVRMVLEDGKLMVQLLAASPKAEELLRSQANGLVASLRATSQELQSVQVVTGTQETQSHMYGGLGANQQGTDGDAQQSRNGGHNGTAHGGRQGGDSTEADYGQQDYRRQETAPRRLLNYAV